MDHHSEDYGNSDLDKQDAQEFQGKILLATKVLELYNATLTQFEELLDHDEFNDEVDDAVRLDDLVLQLRLWRLEMNDDEGAILSNVEDHDPVLASTTLEILKNISRQLVNYDLGVYKGGGVVARQEGGLEMMKDQEPVLTLRNELIIDRLSNSVNALVDLAVRYRDLVAKVTGATSCHLEGEPEKKVEINWDALFDDEDESGSLKDQLYIPEKMNEPFDDAENLARTFAPVDNHSSDISSQPPDAHPNLQKPDHAQHTTPPAKDLCSTEEVFMGAPVHEKWLKCLVVFLLIKAERLYGGGVRSYTSLLILEHIMTLCAQIEHEKDRSDGLNQTTEVDSKLPLPCHYFDYVFGTSNGGILAIMIGRLRMSIGECLETYKYFCHAIFPWPRKLWQLRYNKYDSKRMETVMKEIAKRHCPGLSPIETPSLHDPIIPAKEDDTLRRDRQTYATCRTAVLAVLEKEHHDEVYMFRSYHNPTEPCMREFGKLLNLSHQPDVAIWEAARATSAAPTYFDSMLIDGNRFWDGGLGANNPSSFALHEVESLHQYKHRGTCTCRYGSINQLVSVGTGMTNNRGQFCRSNSLRNGINQIRFARSKMTDFERVHDYMTERMPEETYFRFNVEEGLEDVKLDEYEFRDGVHTTFQKMQSHVQTYLGQPKVKEHLEELSRRLVQHRRSRCKPGEWRAYRGLSQPGPLEAIYLERFQSDNTRLASRLLRGAISGLQGAFQFEFSRTIWVYNYKTSTIKSTNSDDLLRQVGDYSNIVKAPIPLKPGKVPIGGTGDGSVPVVMRLDISWGLRILRSLGLQKSLYVIDMDSSHE